jgi:hypothetical protein
LVSGYAYETLEISLRGISEAKMMDRDRAKQSGREPRVNEE